MENKEQQITLYRDDFVILFYNDDFYKFNDGEIIIYGSLREASEDCGKMLGARTISCYWLDQEKKKELIENIKKFKK